MNSLYFLLSMYFFIGFIFSFIVFLTAIVNDSLSTMEGQFVCLMSILNAFLFWFLFTVFYLLKAHKLNKLNLVRKNFEELL